MNEREELLVKALRSGEYLQGNGYLAQICKGEEDGIYTREIRYCCLGVACEVFRTHSQEPELRRAEGGKTVSYQGHDLYPPDRVLEWFGWDTSGPEGNRGKLKHAMDVTLEGHTATHRNLASLNDFGMEFEEIANIIEQGKMKYASEVDVSEQ